MPVSLSARDFMLNTGAGQAHGWHPHGLLVALGGRRHVAARHGAADVRPVGEVDGEGQGVAAMRARRTLSPALGAMSS